MLITTLLACAGSDHLGADARALLDAIQGLVEAHGDAVSSTASMNDVGLLEADHAAEMEAAMDDMDDTMDQMMGCDMGMTMMGGMRDADSHLGDVMDGAEDHADTHPNHADMGDCMAEEGDYSDTMSDHLDAMRSDLMDFDRGASCGWMM